MYVVNSKKGKPTLSSSISVLFYVILAPLMILDSVFLFHFFEDEYFPVLSIFFILGCVIWFFLVYVAYKESKEIISFVNKTLGYEIARPSKIFFIVGIAVNSILIIFGIVSFFLY